jgi:hypothetical protein
MNPRDKALAFVIMIVNGVGRWYILDGASGKWSGFLGKERRKEEPHEGGKEERDYDNYGPWVAQLSFPMLGHRMEKITGSSIHLPVAPRLIGGTLAESSEATGEDSANSPWKMKMLRWVGQVQVKAKIITARPRS